MNHKFNTIIKSKHIRNPLLAVFIVLITLGSLFAYLSYQNPAYRIIDISPVDGQTDVTLISDIIITLNRTYDTEFPINLQIDPPVQGNYGFRPDNNQIFFSPDTYWQPGTTYTVMIHSPRLKQTERINFTTITVPSSFRSAFNLPTSTPEDSDQVTTPAPQTESDLLDPKFQLISTLPFRTDTFTLKYVIVADHFLIHPRIDNVEQAQADAYQYIATFGITDPKSELSISTYYPITIESNTLEDPAASPSATITPQP